MKRWFIIGLMCVSCVGTEAGNPPDTRKIEVQLTFIEPESALVIGELDVDEVWVSFESIRARPASDCEGDQEFRSAPLVAELISGTEIPPVEIDVETPELCRIEFMFDSVEDGVEDGDIPSTIQNTFGEDSIVVFGERNGVPVEIRSSFDDNVRLDGDIDASNVQTFLLGFELEAWFAGIDWDAVVETDGRLLINDETNSDTLDLIEENIDEAAKFFADTNGDGVLQSEDPITAEVP